MQPLVDATDPPAVRPLLRTWPSRRGSTPAAVVLLLPGGKASSTSPATAGQLAVRRMASLASAVHRTICDRGGALRLLRYRYRGWNEPDLDPVRDTRWALGEFRRDFPGVPVILVGHSMGGRAALRVADDPAVTAVCALAPWIEPGEPVAQLAGTPVVISHGSADRWTSPKASDDFAVQARSISPSTCRFTVDGSGHAMLRRANDWTALVRRFVRHTTGAPDPLIRESHRHTEPAGTAGAAAEGAAVSRERVAVIGAGVSGLTAAYLLQRRYDVTLFEASPRLGGHAHTHDVTAPDGAAVAVDSGFIVHNERTYPNLLRLFGELDVRTQDCEMSMSVLCLGCGLEYAGGKGASGLLSRPGLLGRPRYLRMLAEITRFHRHAHQVLDEPSGGEPTLGEFLAAGRYSRYLVNHFALPLVSAVWSAGERISRDYPARYLFEFLRNHGMLSVTGSPRWRTVVGGSRTYVERAAASLTAVRVAAPVRAIRRQDTGVDVIDAAGVLHETGRVVVATHADQALALLADASPLEKQVLGAFSYSRNETWLHTDTSVLPQTAAARSSWNYLKTSCGADDRVLVSYHMNRLMRLAEPLDYVVTLNAGDRVDDSSVLAKMTYEHPVYTPESVAAQRRLPELNSSRTAFAGAYHGWGFHEDGCAAGTRAAAAFGVSW